MFLFIEVVEKRPWKKLIGKASSNETYFYFLLVLNDPMQKVLRFRFARLGGLDPTAL